jgi:formylglycine-generating enzyme
MKLLPSLLTSLSFALIVACSTPKKLEIISIEGGPVYSRDSITASKMISVNNFKLSAYETTQKEWEEIMGNNPSEFKGDSLPVTNVSWYDCIEYCNKRSEKEGLAPFYFIDKKTQDTTIHDKYDNLRWTVGYRAEANGYRLPSVYEFEYASNGGKASKNYQYAGSNDLKEVGWFWMNSGLKPLSGMWKHQFIVSNKCKTHNVGTKKPNELGLYDMSGNVREWCYEYSCRDISDCGRAWKGGGYAGGDYVCEAWFTRYHTSVDKANDLGLRIVRNK